MFKTLAWVLLAAPLFAATADEQIRQVLNDQTASWNRGDVRAFMEGYENSPETTFIGRTVTKGHAAVLARYLRDYPTRDKMGTLQFSDLEIKVLDQQYASAIGRFHLDRTKGAGDEASGIFTLLFRKTASGWKIILDHTS